MYLLYFFNVFIHCFSLFSCDFPVDLSTLFEKWQPKQKKQSFSSRGRFNHCTFVWMSKILSVTVQCRLSVVIVSRVFHVGDCSTSFNYSVSGETLSFVCKFWCVSVYAFFELDKVRNLTLGATLPSQRPGLKSRCRRFY